MDSTFLQFDVMARETLELSRRLDPSMFDDQSSRADFMPSAAAFRPQGPGLIYRVITGGSTFSLRGFATENIKEAFDEIEGGSREFLASLKMEEGVNEELHHFRCDFVEQAEIVLDHLFNRRFPLHEDVLCNLSDPGYSWWMEPAEDAIIIYFKAQRIDREKNLLKLGPIGDYTMAARRFSELATVMRSMFAVRDFSSDERHLTITPVDAQSEAFQAFRNLFVQGQSLTQFKGFSPESMGRTLFYYLGELASVRKFWCELTPKLNKTNYLA